MIVLNDFDIIKYKTINSKSNNGLTDQFTAHLCYCLLKLYLLSENAEICCLATN